MRPAPFLALLLAVGLPTRANAEDTLKPAFRQEPAYPSGLDGLPMPAAIVCTARMTVEPDGTVSGVVVPEPCPDPFVASIRVASAGWRFYPTVAPAPEQKAAYDVRMRFLPHRADVDVVRAAWDWPRLAANLRARRNRNRVVAWIAIPTGALANLVGIGAAGAAGYHLGRTGDWDTTALAIAGVSGGATVGLYTLGLITGVQAQRLDRVLSTWDEARWDDLRAGFAR